MSEREARDECARLSAEHPDRETHRWVPTQRDGEWVVAKIGLPPPSKDTQPEIRADKQPAIHDDVRSESPLSSPPTIWFGS